LDVVSGNRSVDISLQTVSRNAVKTLNPTAVERSVHQRGRAKCEIGIHVPTAKHNSTNTANYRQSHLVAIQPFHFAPTFPPFYTWAKPTFSIIANC
jgi:hypothetical protein